jgi:cell division protein FtsQ
MKTREHARNGNSAGQGSRRAPVGIALVAMILVCGSLAVLADQWRRHAVGVTVDIRGTVHARAKELLLRASVPDSAILADIDLLLIKKRIEQNPFIKEAVVFREPPSRLIIDVTERKPAALLVNVQSADWVLSEDGVVLPFASTVQAQDLPAITGWSGSAVVKPGALVTDPRLLEALAVIAAIREAGGSAPDMFSEISVERKHDMILYTLDGGVPVIVGSAADIESKFRGFRVFWETIATKHDPDALEYIDLRFKDQLVARWNDGRYSASVVEHPDTTMIQPD